MKQEVDGPFSNHSINNKVIGASGTKANNFKLFAAINASTDDDNGKESGTMTSPRHASFE